MFLDLLSFAVLLLLLASAYVGHGSMLVPGIPLVILTFSVALREYAHKSRQAFSAQVMSYRKEFNQGASLHVDDLLLRNNTELTYFSVNVGVLFTTITIPTSYRLTSSTSALDALPYSLAGLLFGWWSVTGPILTVQHVLQNFTGGERITVSEILARPRFLQKKLEQSGPRR